MQIAIYLVICIALFISVYGNIDSISKEPESIYFPAMNYEINGPEVETLEFEYYDRYSEEDINLIALITMAEAEGCSDYAQRLVIDTILNRVESSIWPNTVYEVIYQKGQFEPTWNGRISRCYVDQDMVALVKEEIASRTNNEVIYFRNNHYFSWATPLVNDSNVYFSK